MESKFPMATIKNDFKYESKFLETFQENQEFYAWHYHLKLQKRQELLRRSVARWR